MKSNAVVTGTTPPGAPDEKQTSQWVQRMFARIAPRYDFLNHLLSFNIDRSWRKALLEKLRWALENPNAVVLDLCCGTGDVYLDLSRVAKAQVIGADFCHLMLTAADAKARRKNVKPALLEADALVLPFADGELDCISIAFGFRNLANYSGGLAELLRVLKPGGQVAILEFSHPSNLLVKLGYGFYSRVILPIVGTIVSGSREAYTYLPSSIRKFPKAPALAETMRSAGFSRAEYRLLTGGIAALHIGTK
ncbi:MAG: bifunctional demethylmenaquinone methyltransferase/2-methoxy-6-polyprenyl-1,4-benzoquinol methylase UbiE [Bryobacteraceae bacterium]